MESQRLAMKSQPVQGEFSKVAIQDKESQLTARLLEVFGEEPVASFSRRSGIGDSTLRKYVGGAVPSAINIAAIADAGNVNIEWLATGRGPKLRGAPAQAPPVQPQPASVPMAAPRPTPAPPATSPPTTRPSAAQLLPRVVFAASRAHWLPAYLGESDVLQVATTAVDMLAAYVQDDSTRLFQVTDGPHLIQAALRLSCALHGFCKPKPDQ
jgi:hypothetical protein